MKSCSLLLAPLSLLAAPASTNEALPGLHPPRPEIPPGFWETSWGWFVAGAAVVIAAAGILVWLLKRPKPLPVALPEVEIRKRLAQLQSQPETGAQLTAISQALRRYFVRAFGLPPEELTTTELCQLVSANEGVGSELADAVSAFLRRCDERKFAPASAAEPLNGVAAALGIVEKAEGRREAAAKQAAQVTHGR